MPLCPERSSRHSRLPRYVRMIVNAPVSATVPAALLVRSAVPPLRATVTVFAARRRASVVAQVAARPKNSARTATAARGRRGMWSPEFGNFEFSRCVPLPPGEGAAKRRVRDFQGLRIPHPALRATFSRWEKALDTIVTSPRPGSSSSATTRVQHQTSATQTPTYSPARRCRHELQGDGV